MKLALLILAACMASAMAFAFTPQMRTITLDDGEQIECRIYLPENEVKTIVFCIPGTGTSTYLTKRSTFNYFDELANGFCEQGVALFTYNRRGCTVGQTAPQFVDVDSAKYAKYTPLQEAADVEAMVRMLRKDKRFKSCKIALYGVSEGTIIAPLVAERGEVQIDALLLHGYAHDNMYDLIKWQNQGDGVMIIVNSFFDQNSDKRISREEYEDSAESRIAPRGSLFQNMPFDTLDVVKDCFIDIEDIRKMRAPYNDYLLKCITEDNYQWIKSNYFNITPEWCKAHFVLEPNKTRLLRLDIPIFIFHGADDANVPAESVHDLKSRFSVCNKSNLQINVFEKHNHDLNFTDWLTKKEWPEGFKTIFSVAQSI